METTIRRGRPEDEEPLRELLVSYGMDLAGGIEAHTVAMCDGQIIGGGMVSHIGEDLYHLEVLAVDDKWRGTGTGRLLLSALTDAPWQYSGGGEPPQEIYTVTTVARGDAVPFYSGCGFAACGFAELAAPYDDQCNQCPDRDDCQPVPMIFRRGIRI